MSSPTVWARRVVFGISGQAGADGGLELALEMAKSMNLMVRCLLPERRDLLAAAALPFARLTSQGGLSLPVTQEDMAVYLRRQQRLAEESVTARCGRAGLSLSIERPPGEYVSDLLSSVAEGDVVVVELEAADLAQTVEALLRKVSAVVLPGTGQARPKAVLSVADHVQEPSPTIAEDIAGALGLPMKRLQPVQLLSAGILPTVIVVPAHLIADLGGIAEIRRRGGRTSTVILVRNGD